MKLVVHFDGGSRGNPGPAGAGVVVEDAQGRPVFEAGFFLGRMTNNMAEYNGLLRGLEAAARANAHELTIFADSELVVRQLNGDYRVKNPNLRDLFDVAFARLKQFQRWTLKHIPREQNHRADELANAAMDAQQDVVVLDTIASYRSSTSRRGDGEHVVLDALPSAPKSETPPKASSDKPASPRRRSAQSPAPVQADGHSPRAAADRPTRTSAAPPHARPTGSVVVRCVKAPDPAVCPAPCSLGAEFLFDCTAPAGLCLGIAAQALRAVEAVHKSRKPAEAFCSHEGCGACFVAEQATGDTSKPG